MDKRALDSRQLNYFEQINSDHHREFVNAHNNCVLCGTVLELRHLPLADSPSIKEEAHCPECEMRTRAKIYTLN
jgi:hypothetical protein